MTIARIMLGILFFVQAGRSPAIPSPIERIWSFDWRPRSRAETVGEISAFSLRGEPVAGGEIRRPEGEFGVIRRGGGTYHKGIDFLAPEGTLVRAPRDGFVCYSGLNGTASKGYGYTVMIDHADNFYTLYAHLMGESPLPVGTWVKAGQMIGRVGRSGNAMQLPKEYQYQLHFEILHAPSGLMDMGGLRFTALLSPRRITTLREIGEAVYGVYWGGSLNPEEYGKW